MVLGDRGIMGPRGHPGGAGGRGASPGSGPRCPQGPPGSGRGLAAAALPAAPLGGRHGVRVSSPSHRPASHPAVPPSRLPVPSRHPSSRFFIRVSVSSSSRVHLQGCLRLSSIFVGFFVHLQWFLHPFLHPSSIFNGFSIHPSSIIHRQWFLRPSVIHHQWFLHPSVVHRQRCLHPSILNGFSMHLSIHCPSSMVSPRVVHLQWCLRPSIFSGFTISPSVVRLQ